MRHFFLAFICISFPGCGSDDIDSVDSNSEEKAEVTISDQNYFVKQSDQGNWIVNWAVTVKNNSNEETSF